MSSPPPRPPASPVERHDARIGCAIDPRPGPESEGREIVAGGRVRVVPEERRQLGRRSRGRPPPLAAAPGCSGSSCPRRRARPDPPANVPTGRSADWSRRPERPPRRARNRAPRALRSGRRGKDGPARAESRIVGRRHDEAALHHFRDTGDHHEPQPRERGRTIWLNAGGGMRPGDHRAASRGCWTVRARSPSPILASPDRRPQRIDKRCDRRDCQTASHPPFHNG